MMKSKKQDNPKSPDSPLATFYSLIKLSLLLMGIVGLAFNAFREGGWYENMLETITTMTVSTMVGTAIIIALFIFIMRILSRDPDKVKGMSAVSTTLLYIMMAVGAWMTYKLIIQGSFLL